MIDPNKIIEYQRFSGQYHLGYPIYEACDREIATHVILIDDKHPKKYKRVPVLSG